jgi:multiple sugar transport system ATP-binding protein
VAVLKDGLLQQVGSPRELYDRPRNAFVAGFIGSPAMNLAEVPLTDGGARLGDLTVPLPTETLAATGPDTTVTLGFRPESLQLSADGQGFRARVDLVEELGSDAYVYASLLDREVAEYLHGGDTKQIVARVDARRPPQAGEQVNLAIRTGEEHVFSSSTGERLPS